MRDYLSFLPPQYAYLAAFLLLVGGVIGLPVPDELMMLFLGYESRQGRLELVLCMPFAAMGSMCGITVSYLLGRGLGLPLVLRYGRFVHLTPDRLARARRWFERVGHWTLLVGYFIPGFRHLMGIVAGGTGLRWPHFALFAYAGAAVWSASIVLAGYFAGREVPAVIAAVRPYLRVITIIAVAASALGLALWLALHRPSRR